MERTKETLEARVRETPLVDRLKECQQRIGNMCAELRGPKMSIPVEYYDDDFYICTTLADAQATVEALRAQLEELKANRVPHSMQHVIELQAMNNRLNADLTSLRDLVGVAVSRWRAQTNAREGMSFTLAMKELERTMHATLEAGKEGWG